MFLINTRQFNLKELDQKDIFLGLTKAPKI